MSELLAIRILPVAPACWTLESQAAWAIAGARWLPEPGWTLELAADGALAWRFAARQLELAAGAWAGSDRARAAERAERLLEALETLVRTGAWPEEEEWAASAAARELGRALPRASAWAVSATGLAGPAGALRIAAVHLRAAAGRAARPRKRRATPGRVTAQVAAVDFERGLVRFACEEAAPDAALTIAYPPAWERRLLRLRGEALRISGALVFDGEGRLAALESLEDVEPVDTSELVLTELLLGGEAVPLAKPLPAPVSYLPAEGGCYEARLPRLGIAATALEREGLTAALAQALAAALEDPQAAPRLGATLAPLLAPAPLEDWAS